MWCLSWERGHPPPPPMSGRRLADTLEQCAGRYGPSAGKMPRESAGKAHRKAVAKTPLRASTAKIDGIDKDDPRSPCTAEFAARALAVRTRSGGVIRRSDVVHAGKDREGIDMTDGRSRIRAHRPELRRRSRHRGALRPGTSFAGSTTTRTGSGTTTWNEFLAAVPLAVGRGPGARSRPKEVSADQVKGPCDGTPHRQDAQPVGNYVGTPVSLRRRLTIRWL